MLRGEFDENSVSEDFRPSELYAIAKALEKREQQAAKKRQAEANPAKAGGRKRPLRRKFPEAVKGRSRDKLGKIAGTSGRNLQKIAEVCKAGKAEPKKYQPLPRS